MEPEGRREKGEGRGRRGTVGTAQRPYTLAAKVLSTIQTGNKNSCRFIR